MSGVSSRWLRSVMGNSRHCCLLDIILFQCFSFQEMDITPFTLTVGCQNRNFSVTLAPREVVVIYFIGCMLCRLQS